MKVKHNIGLLSGCAAMGTVSRTKLQLSSDRHAAVVFVALIDRHRHLLG
jgi:hypothetical protein